VPAVDQVPNPDVPGLKSSVVSCTVVLLVVTVLPPADEHLTVAQDDCRVPFASRRKLGGAVLVHVETPSKS